MLYVVSYDLNKPGQDYPKIITELERLGAKRVLLSQWGVRLNNMTAQKLRDHLWSFMDSNDRILVVETEGTGWSAMNLINKLSEM